VFLDESGANLKMTTNYGWGEIGTRIKYASPHQRGTKFSILGAIGFNEIKAAFYGDWSTDSEAFLHFIEKELCPKLKPGDVVVMDNVSFHKNSKITDAIESVKANVLYLPPYSPEFNPIENMWSKIKSNLKKSAARTVDEFHVAIKKAFESVSSFDLTGWFKHCGYSDQGFREQL